MKKFLVVLLVMASISIAMGQKPAQVVKSDIQHLTVEFRAGNLMTTTTAINEEKYTVLEMDGYCNSSSVGDPMLPVNVSLIEIPICEEISYKILNVQYDTIDLELNYQIMPAQPSRCKSDNQSHELKINKEVYSQDKYFTFPLVQVKNMGIARDKNLAKIIFAPIQYNPQSGKIIVCTNAEIQFDYINVDEKATIKLKEYSTPAFSIGQELLNNLDLSVKEHRTSTPIKMLIVSNSMFRGELDEYIAWKRRKGFIVDIAYTDQTEVGTSSSSIISYIKNFYTNATEADPAPTYVLLVGDVAQLPTCADQYPVTSWWGGEEHQPTDFYYAEWTNDMLPDAYYGRFSAQNKEQLANQIEKTLMYEQYTFKDPTFLDNAVLVAGADYNFGCSHADPTISQVAKFYVNGDNGYAQVKCFQNNMATNPGATNVSVYTNTNPSTVKAAYNEGAGWINYTAHGDKDCWADPVFTNSDVHLMSNTQKFGVMIGNCCLTNKYDYPECFGEALVRQGNYTGAVAYIGGSNYTYWDEDVYWSMGVRRTIAASMPLVYDENHLGMYDQLFHLNNESHDKWITCLGGIIYAGDMSVETSASSLNNYYWEVYHVMGDPSIAPWLTQASDMTIIPLSLITTESTSARYVVAPYSYVALTQDSVLIAATYADESGMAVLNFNNLNSGDYEVAASVMGYKTKFVPVHVQNVGIENATDMQLSIYPNPTSSFVTVEADNIQEVSVVNVLGSTLMSERVNSNKAQIDIQSLSNGVYFIKVKALDKVAIRKIIKE